MTEARAIPAGQDALAEDLEASGPPLNILLTTYTFDPDIGDVTSFNMDLCEELVRLGQNVTLASLTPGEDHGRRFRVVRPPRPDQLFRLGSRADVILFSNLSLQFGASVDDTAQADGIISSFGGCLAQPAQPARALR